jgi:predicted nucleic acid-binding Zn finger protein
MKVTKVKVPSSSEQGKFWTVHVFSEGNRIVEMKCDCPSFVLAKKGKEPCKHIAKVQENIGFVLAQAKKKGL